MNAPARRPRLPLRLTVRAAVCKGELLDATVFQRLIFGQPVQYQTNIITSGALQIASLIEGLVRGRSGQRGQYFPDVSTFLSVPELSTTSPWLDQTGEQWKFGLTDEAYEILPSQLLARVRPDPVGFAGRGENSIALRFSVWDGPAYGVECSADGNLWTPFSAPHHGTNGVFTLTAHARSEAGLERRCEGTCHGKSTARKNCGLAEAGAVSVKTPFVP